MTGDGEVNLDDMHKFYSEFVGVDKLEVEKVTTAGHAQMTANGEDVHHRLEVVEAPPPASVAVCLCLCFSWNQSLDAGQFLQSQCLGWQGQSFIV